MTETNQAIRKAAAKRWRRADRFGWADGPRFRRRRRGWPADAPAVTPHFIRSRGSRRREIGRTVRAAKQYAANFAGRR